MASSIGSSSSLSFGAFSSSRGRCSKGCFSKVSCGRQQPYIPPLNNLKGKTIQVRYGITEAKRNFPMKQTHLFATTEDHSSDNELTSDAEQHKQLHDVEGHLQQSNLPLQYEGAVGRPGFMSFYGRSPEKKEEVLELSPSNNQSNLIWFVGPSVLVASFIFPSLYMRRILSSIFEDSLLTDGNDLASVDIILMEQFSKFSQDFLILFFAEALFYFGVAVFLVLNDRAQQSLGSVSYVMSSLSRTTQLMYRISSVAILVLSLIIPMVTMGLVWPWTGPAASATLAPYLVGIVMQFAFEQYAKYVKSPSWPVIPIIFQVYRLHQLNRAAQLVSALSFTIRGAEITSHNMAIGNSLGILLRVLQFLGVICIWSLASFLSRFYGRGTKPE